MISFRSTRKRRALRARATLALTTAGLAAAVFAAPAAAGPATGNVSLTFKKGAASSLLREGVKLTKAGGKSQTVKLTVKDLDFGAKTTLQTRGALTFRTGEKSATLNALELSIGAKATTVSARAGKGRLVFFRATGTPTFFGDSVSFEGPLSLTGNGAKALRQKLGLPGISVGQVGSASAGALLDAVPAPAPTPKQETPPPPPPKELDPYFEQCKVSATSEAKGDAPAPVALPTLADAKQIVAPDALAWGFKASFRGYLIGVAGGSLHALDGASTVGSPPVFSGFEFPLDGGEYAANDPVDISDDQAIVDGSGSAVFCGTKHNFRIVLSNPTVVIDGEDSRIVMDVDTNLSGVWTPTQRVDFAELDLDATSPFYNHSGSEVSWANIPATLTEAGADAFGGEFYVAGEPLDPISVTVNTPYDLGAKDAAAWTALASYVSTELPFPLPTATAGGCDLTVPAGGTAALARTIDEHVGYGGSTSLWYANGPQAAVIPDLSSDTAVIGGALDWGFRGSLRGSINGTGAFNPALGAIASHTPYYGNGGLTPVSPPRVPPGEMGNVPGRHFSWPSQPGASFYDAGAPGSADDRLVLRTDGRVGFCQSGTGQWYGTVFSNPTVVIDGAQSRVTMDVATRYRLSWVRGVVDFASIDLSAATFAETENAGTTTVSWTLPDAVSDVGPVKLTAGGESVVRMISAGTYKLGLGLDGTTIKASFPTPGP